MSFQQTKATYSLPVPGDRIQIFNPSKLVGYPTSCKQPINGFVSAARLCVTKPHVQYFVEYPDSTNANAHDYARMWLMCDQVRSIAPEPTEYARIDKATVPPIRLGSRVWGADSTQAIHGTIGPAYVIGMGLSTDYLYSSTRVDMIARQRDIPNGVMYLSDVPITEFCQKTSDKIVSEYTDSSTIGDFVLSADFPISASGPSYFFPNDSINKDIISRLEDHSLYEFL